MGKSLVDPRQLYKTKDLTHAAKCFLSDVASSYRLFLQVPFVSQFVCSFYDPIKTQVHEAIERHQVQTSDLHTRALLPEAYDQICLRYGFDRELLEATLAIFPTQPLTFYSSPLFHKLVAADYW